MISLILNGKKVLCPGCYEELTTGKYQRIIKEWDPDEPDLAKRDYFKLFSILTGTAYTSMKQTPENEVTIWNAIHWFITQPFKFSTTLPKVLEIAGKKVSIPKNAGMLSIGQNVHLVDVIKRSRFMEENISRAVAICLQPLYHGGKYDHERVDELEAIVLEMPIYLTHPVGFFLLQTVRLDGLKRTSAWRRTRNSLKQIFKGTWPRWPRSNVSGSLTTYPS